MRRIDCQTCRFFWFVTNTCKKALSTKNKLWTVTAENHFDLNEPRLSNVVDVIWMQHSQNDNGDGCARGVWVDGGRVLEILLCFFGSAWLACLLLVWGFCLWFLLSSFLFASSFFAKYLVVLNRFSQGTPAHFGGLSLDPEINFRSKPHTSICNRTVRFRVFEGNLESPILRRL